MGKATPANYHHFLGIDVSKDTIDCLLRPSGTYSQWTNRDEGFERLHRWLGNHHCSQQHTLICIEDTGIYSDRLLAGLTSCGWKCAVVKTTATEKVAPEHHRKDDRFDADLLAEYGQRYTDRITLTGPPEETVKQLQQLYGERQRLIKARGATQNRSQQAAHALVDSELLAQPVGPTTSASCTTDKLRRWNPRYMSLYVAIPDSTSTTSCCGPFRGWAK